MEDDAFREGTPSSKTVTCRTTLSTSSRNKASFSRKSWPEAESIWKKSTMWERLPLTVDTSINEIRNGGNTGEGERERLVCIHVICIHRTNERVVWRVTRNREGRRGDHRRMVHGQGNDCEITMSRWHYIRSENRERKRVPIRKQLTVMNAKKDYIRNRFWRNEEWKRTIGVVNNGRWNINYALCEIARNEELREDTARVGVLID